MATELRLVREQYGFGRTRCDCAACAAPCRFMPGSLDVTDLDRLCPPGTDLFAWAEEHLRAVTGKPYPTLVPARRADGACHWLFEGRCAVHEHAPYSCAFFDTHQGDDEVARRSDATIRARTADAAAGGTYFRLWTHLRDRKLIARPADRAGLADALRRLRDAGPSSRP